MTMPRPQVIVSRFGVPIPGQNEAALEFTPPPLEVMQEIAEIDARFAYIEACGTSREDALKMARTCAQLGYQSAQASLTFHPTTRRLNA